MDSFLMRAELFCSLTKYRRHYVLVAVNLVTDVDQDEKRDGGKDDVDEAEVGDVTKHPVEKSGKWIQDPERNDVQARQRRDLRIPLENGG